MTVDSRPLLGLESWVKAGFRLVPWRPVRLAIPAALLGGLVLSGCGVMAPFRAAPPIAAPTARQAQFESAPSIHPLQTPATSAVRPVKANKPKAAAGLAPASPPDPRHRQYFDERRHRFYYFDPVLKAYFWEDGAPR